MGGHGRGGRLPNSESAGSGVLGAVELAARQVWTFAGLSSVSRAHDGAGGGRRGRDGPRHEAAQHVGRALSRSGSCSSRRVGSPCGVSVCSNGDADDPSGLRFRRREGSGPWLDRWTPGGLWIPSSRSARCGTAGSMRRVDARVATFWDQKLPPRLGACRRRALPGQKLSGA